MNHAIGSQPDAAHKVIPKKKSSSASQAAYKWERELRELLKGPRTSRELEREPVFDHCAHSTISELRKKGVDIDTEIVEIPGYAGLPARIARYTLTPSGRDRAMKLLGGRQ